MVMLVDPIHPNADEIIDDEKFAIIENLREHTLGGRWDKVFEIYQQHPWIHTRKITTSEDTAMLDEEFAIIEELREQTLGGSWDKVVEIYQQHPWIHTRKITTSEDTALHMAVDNGKEVFIEQLVKEIMENEKREAKSKEDQQKGKEIVIDEIKALEMKNACGDTPLHLAASRGFAAICLIIAKENGHLLTIKNNKGETPIFLAALNWHRDAFLCLHNMYKHHGRKVELDSLRRNNGDTILHCAIKREHLDLAVIIVEFYKDVPLLINSVNRKGYTPLKMLATRPAAFKSRSNLRWLKYILYHCTPIDEGLALRSAEKWSVDNISKKDCVIDVPKNYLTCYYFIASLLKLGYICGWPPTSNNRKGRQDAEDPDISESPQTVLPKNYATDYDFIRSTIGIVGYGLMDLKKMKEKHVWSVRLLNILLEKPTDAYMEGGNQPIRLSSSYGVEWGKDPLGEGTSNAIRKKGLMDRKGMEIHACCGVRPLQKSIEKSSGAYNEGVFDHNQSSSSDGEESDKNPLPEKLLNPITKKEAKKATTLLIAAKNGILEMVEKILHKIPTAIHETTSEKKNILLVAVESRQPHIIKALQKNDLWENLLLGVDKEGNTVMHLAAKSSNYRAWQITGSAMNMLWDIKWYQYVKNIAPKHLLFRDNKKGKTPAEIFSEDHQQLVNESSNWLKETSQSCSVVAALIAGVAFATSSTVPGGNNDETGKPTFEGQPAFELFAITSLVALCSSVTALILFLAILTSRKEVRDFSRSLPLKLILGLSSLFVSIASMLVSFCAAHFFVLKDKFKEILFPIYAATCLPISLYAVAQFPLYIDLLRAILTKVPQPSYKEDDL